MKMNKLAVAALAALSATAAWAVQGTIKTDSVTKRGVIRWQRGSKTYAVTFKNGQVETKLEFPKDAVRELKIDKPASFDKLAALVNEGKGASAIAGLTQIVNEYKMLQWDKEAGRHLVKAYLAANNAQKAYDVAKGIIDDDSSSAWSGELAPAYWEALLKLGQITKLESCLSKAAASADRRTSAAALVARGDVILASGGDQQATYRKALTDAYLRVVLMYRDEACKDVRAQAISKAADCLDKLGLSVRAESLRAEGRGL